jgi:hypothetical protein
MKPKKYVYKQKIDKKSQHYKSFMRNLRAYKKFIEINGRLPMQRTVTTFRPRAEHRLYTWAAQLKHYKSKQTLPEWKYDLLNEIPGFLWSKQNNVWYSKFEECKNYIERYGITPPQIRMDRFPERIENGKWISPIDDKLHRLSVWCLIQRNHYRKNTLKPDRLDNLINIGFDFEPEYGPAYVTDKEANIKTVQGMDSEDNIKYLLNEQKGTWRF